jgi:predicted nucleotidyltransferase
LELVSAESNKPIEEYRRNFKARLKRQLEKRERTRQQALRAVWETAPAIISSWQSVRRAYLFGSVTRLGAFHEASDVDIAVEGITAQEYFALWQALERALPDWAIDVRDITPASPFGDLIRKTGVLIYERTDSSTTSRDSG